MIPAGHIVVSNDRDRTMGVVVERPPNHRKPQANGFIFVRWQSGWTERVLTSTVREMEYSK